VSREQAPYRRTAEALAELLDRSQPGEALPSEPKLAEQLGVSRATLRDAMRAFQERGLIVRRQGVGTYVGPKLIEAGLEELVSIETLAAQIGLPVAMAGLSVEHREPSQSESESFGLRNGRRVVEIARVIRAAGKPVAYLIDVIADGLIPDEVWGSSFRGSVLDLLLDRGEVPLEYSRTEINAVAADRELAARMELPLGEVLLLFEASLVARDGSIVDRSRSYFLPGTFRFQVVRQVGAAAGVSRLLPV
jgi:GntR family transcriptional regulator